MCIIPEIRYVNICIDSMEVENDNSSVHDCTENENFDLSNCSSDDDAISNVIQSEDGNSSSEDDEYDGFCSDGDVSDGDDFEDDNFDDVALGHGKPNRLKSVI
jgi:hypothetical protein